MNATISANKEHNGIEVSFQVKPGRDIIDSLKEHGFRWHSVKKLWYAKNTASRLAAVTAICNSDIVERTESPEKANKFGVKVGDIFSASWGYEQTNNDFFQVVELVGSQSVRVREVNLPMIESCAVSGMSEDRTFEITRELLQPVSSSVFIKDQERGDLKRLKSYAADGKSDPQFNLSSFANAHLCTGNKIKVYESWYA